VLALGAAAVLEGGGPAPMVVAGAVAKVPPSRVAVRHQARLLTVNAPAPEPTPVLAAHDSGLTVLTAGETFEQLVVARNPPAIVAAGGILVDVDTGTVIWDRAPHVARPPASTAKILSTMVALQNLPLDQVVTITQEALGQESDETRLGMHPGDRFTVRELLQSMMLVSANDAAKAIAVDTIGMPRFVAGMNEQVAALNLHDSHFTTTVGLDDDQQLASPYDLAVIAAAAYDGFPLFRELASTRLMQLPASDMHPHHELRNLDRLLEIYPPAVGIKPGFTYAAGPCLVSMAIRDGHRLVGVLMNAPNMYVQMRTLLDWGFTREGLAALVPAPPPPSAPPAPQVTVPALPRNAPRH
jgi:D-alanyl-D-alanine carboxypeptidase (penicillin-binding protein 5/6)